MKTLSTYTLKNAAYTLIISLCLLFTSACKKNKTPEPTPEDPATLLTITKITNGLISGNPNTVTDIIGKPNDLVNIYGRNFSQDFKNSKVLFNDISAQVRYGDSTSLMVVIPDNVSIGPVSITVVSNGKSFTLPNKLKVEPPVPKIDRLSTETGILSSKLIIYGSDFSSTTANNKVTINGINAVVDSASSTQVYLSVPQTAGKGKLVLTTHGKTVTYGNDLTILPSTYTILPGTYYYSPFGLSLDAAGNLYGVAGNNVLKISPAGTSTVLATIGAPADLSFLAGCTVDAAGNVYVSSPYDRPAPTRTVFSNNSSKVYKISPTGTVSVLAGSSRGYVDGPGNTARFSNPNELFADAAGNIYVHDDQYIRKISPTGQVSTFAGTATGPAADGQGTAASFNFILAFGGDPKTGDMYVVESMGYNNNDQYYNGRIRKISATGMVSTPAITPFPGSPANSQFPKVSRYNTNLTVDAAGALYVATDIYIYKIKDGAVTNTYLNPSGGAVLSMTFDAAGKLNITAPKSFSPFSDNNGASHGIFRITL